MHGVRWESRWLRIAVALAIMVALDLTLVYVWYRPQVERFAARYAIASLSDRQVSDAAVVFFGALRDDGALDAETRQRVERAASLFARGLVREVIAVGGARPGRERPGSALMADHLAEHGVPRNHISHDSASYDSVSNWAQAERIARQHNLDSLVLVSSPTHVMRLARIARGSALTIAWYSGDAPFAGARSAASEWRIAHHEILALTALRFLPRQWYVSLVKRVRNVS